MAHKGLFKPKHPEKYKGNPTNIVYRSMWECKFMMYCDDNKNVIEWGSEEVIVPYISPIDNKRHRYYVDFLLKIRNKEGLIETLLIEIKPAHQQVPPTPMNTKKQKPTKRYIQEVYTWGVNSAKWAAARKLCSQNGWKFLILGEKELNIKF